MHRFFLLSDRNIEKAKRRGRREIRRTKSMNKIKKSEKEEALLEIKGVEEIDSKLQSDSHDVTDEQKLIKNQDKNEKKKSDEKIEGDASTSTEKYLNSSKTTFTDNDVLMNRELKQHLSAFKVKPYIKIKSTPDKNPEKKKSDSFDLINDDLMQKYFTNKGTDHVKEPSDLSNEDKLLYSLEDVSHLNSNNLLQKRSLDNNSIATNDTGYVSNECISRFQNESYKKNNSETEMLPDKIRSHKTSSVKKLIDHFDNSREENHKNENNVKNSTMNENGSSFPQSSNISGIETSEKEDLDEDSYCSERIKWNLNCVSSKSTEGMYLFLQLHLCIKRF